MDGLNVILAAVSVGLGSFFPNVPVYPELVPEKVPERCFLIGFARRSGGFASAPWQPESLRDAGRYLSRTGNRDAGSAAGVKQRFLHSGAGAAAGHI